MLSLPGSASHVPLSASPLSPASGEIPDPAVAPLAELGEVSLAASLPLPAVWSTAEAQLLALWLHGRSRHTQRAYAASLTRFRRVIPKPLAAVTLADLQQFALTLAERAPATQHRALSALKSLFAFGHRTGHLAHDVGRVLRLPALPSRLAERILSEADVHRLLSLEAQPRNRAVLLLLYGAGLRVSELCGLRRRDLQPVGDTGQVTVFGKGGKTRAVQLPLSVWQALTRLGELATSADEPLFRSRTKGQALTPSGVGLLVQQAARRAGIAGAVSPHWLRHAHASHALDRGAPIHLVQATLGHASVTATGRYLHARPQDSSSHYLPL